jgi:hypothetical protein
MALVEDVLLAPFAQGREIPHTFHGHWHTLPSGVIYENARKQPVFLALAKRHALCVLGWAPMAHCGYLLFVVPCRRVQGVKLNELFSKQPITAAPTATLESGVVLMQWHNIGAAVITDARPPPTDAQLALPY